MEDEDASQQVERMVAFIKQEALEKSHEISVSCEEEYNILKQQILETEQRKIKQEYERKEKQMDMRKKIEYSMQLNNSRLKVLQAQDDLVQVIKMAAQKQMYGLSANHRVYKHLIRDLIVQLAKDRYAAIMKAHPPDVVVNEKTFLAGDEDSSKSGRTCAGGVVITSRDGRIICDNTLDSRLEVTFKQILPEIRRRFFANRISTVLAGT